MLLCCQRLSRLLQRNHATHHTSHHPATALRDHDTSCTILFCSDMVAFYFIMRLPACSGLISISFAFKRHDMATMCLPSLPISVHTPLAIGLHGRRHTKHTEASLAKVAVGSAARVLCAPKETSEPDVGNLLRSLLLALNTATSSFDLTI
jgi:hypothetical protein